MSVPSPHLAQPFAPLGQPLLQGQPGREYLPIPSPVPPQEYDYAYEDGRRPRSRERTHSSHGHHHHHSSGSRQRHHSSSHGHRHHSSSRRHDSHGHRSHSRGRHHSDAPPPPNVVMLQPQYDYGQQQQQPAPYGFVPPQMQAVASYGPPVAAPHYAPSQSYAPQVQYAHSQPAYAVPSVPRGLFTRAQSHQPYSQTQQHAAQASPHAHTKPMRPSNVMTQGRNNHSFMHPLFHYSRCTGQRKAVCIGVNYAGTAEELGGCANDAKNVYHYLVDHAGYPRKNVLYLVDSSANARARPTRANVLEAMRWLVRDAREDDALFFHYSGHGGQVVDRDGDEADGMDEVIFPEDYRTAGVITDDEMHEVMVAPLPPGCRLTALFDSCHSGSILDLPYLYHSDGRVKGSDVSRAFREKRMTPADVITWSGSSDAQTSADTVQGGLAVGAMSYAFLKVLKRQPEISYQELLRGVREVLRKKYSQKPQLSSSHRIDTGLRFII